MNNPMLILKCSPSILKERTGRKGAELFLPLRVALTGQAHGPELAPLLDSCRPESRAPHG